MNKFPPYFQLFMTITKKLDSKAASYSNLMKSRNEKVKIMYTAISMSLHECSLTIKNALLDHIKDRLDN